MTTEHREILGSGKFVPDTLDHVIVDLGNSGPIGGNLGGETVVGVLRFHSLELVVDILLGPVQVGEPRFYEFTRHLFDDSVLKPGERLLNTPADGLDHVPVALGHEDEDAVSLVEVREMLPGILLGVGPGHRRAITVHHHFPQDFDARTDVFDEAAVKAIVFAEIAEHFHGNFGDAAECSFAADGDVANIGAAGTAGNTLDSAYPPIGEHAFEARHHVFDTAVEG